MSNEKRVFSIKNFEIRNDDDKTPKIAGYAALFEEETTIGAYFREKIARGAFKDALQSSDVHALYNHDYGIVLGRAQAGTLRLKEDKTGLFFEVDLPDTQDARDLAVKMERGDIDQASFQFTMRGGVEEWDESDEDGLPLRTIRSVGELYDVSICPRGAYPQTEVGLRDMAKAGLDSLKKHKKSHNFNAAARRVRMKVDLDLKARE